MPSASGTRSGPTQRETRPCAYCSALFAPKREWEQFCKPGCRRAYDLDFGTRGAVKSVRKLKAGVSVVIHLPGGPAAERALKLALGELVRIVRGPE